jgi:hypothetical protein
MARLGRGYLRVITHISRIWFLLTAPGVRQKVYEGPEPGPPKVAKLSLVQLHDHRIETGKKLQPLSGYASPNKTPVFSLTAAHHQAGVLQPIQKPRRVRDPCDEAVSHLVAAESGRAGPTQDSQRIVLCRAQAVGPECIEHVVLELSGRSRQTQHRLLLQAAERLRGL